MGLIQTLLVLKFPCVLLLTVHVVIYSPNRRETPVGIRGAASQDQLVADYIYIHIYIYIYRERERERWIDHLAGTSTASPIYIYIYIYTHTLHTHI